MSDAILDEISAFLRGHTTADLRFDEHLRPIKYVFAPDGRLAAPVMVAMLQSVDTVLYIPEYAADAIEVQVTLEQFDERGPDGAVADRWRIYHGEPEDVRWAFVHLDAIRYGEMIVDGEPLMQPNPLAADESRICREMNQNHVDDLRRLSVRFSPSQMEIEKPVMVGIDPFGIDIRARFQVVRVPVKEMMHNAKEAQKILQAMMQSAKK